MPKPPITRHMAICMQRIRPIRSARRPAVAAPNAQPISAAAITWASTSEPTSNRSRIATTAPLMTELSYPKRKPPMAAAAAMKMT